MEEMKQEVGVGETGWIRKVASVSRDFLMEVILHVQCCNGTSGCTNTCGKLRARDLARFKTNECMNPLSPCLDGLR